MGVSGVSARGLEGGYGPRYRPVQSPATRRAPRAPQITEASATALRVALEAQVAKGRAASWPNACRALLLDDRFCREVSALIKKVASPPTWSLACDIVRHHRCIVAGAGPGTALLRDTARTIERKLRRKAGAPLPSFELDEAPTGAFSGVRALMDGH